MRRAAIALLLMAGAAAGEPRTVTGRVVDEDGFGVQATVEVNGSTATCGRTGIFLFEEVTDAATLLSVFEPRHFTEYRIVNAGATHAGIIRMRRRETGRSRLVFGGDAMMGRRFMNLYNAEAPKSPLLRPKTFGGDAAAVLADIAPILRTADFAIVNLETVLAEDPGTPVKKSFAFHSHPEMAEALFRAGIDLVTLGNNHCWDYGADGLKSTMEGLNTVGIVHCGAGLNEKDASRAGIVKRGSHRIAVLSYSGIAGSDTPLLAAGDRGGAAAMTEEAIRAGVKAAKADGAVVIVALHAGTEYRDTPTARVRLAARAAAAEGAALVVCHHPHTPSGFEVVDRTLIAYGLGNFVFDQSRWEALPGLLLTVDLQGDRVTGASFLPLVHEDYVPRLAAGEFARHVTRRVAAVSEGVPVFWANGRAILGLDEPRSRASEDTVCLVPTEPLKLLLPEASTFLSRAVAIDGRIEAGRDLLRIGGFEDPDVDDSKPEAGPWSGEYSFGIWPASCRSGHSCLRFAFAAGDKSRNASTTHRVPVPSTFTLAGWTRAENAGELRVALDWCKDGDLKRTSRRTVLRVPGGTRGWTAFHVEVGRPKDMFSVRVRLSADAPGEGAGRVDLDDLAIVAWSPLKGDLPLTNDADWVRLVGTKEAQAVDLDFEVLEE